ncbi:hypothetical protein AALO_G00252650 [Alosa alosa]|uniref:histone deacetylase n=1 Tax=Alosa alosa TaxID=278164 RepID=A0AAV6FPC4_9TELE|nr:hypothetical protein AALO_G00252650 [Alosa alosa]
MMEQQHQHQQHHQHQHHQQQQQHLLHQHRKKERSRESMNSTTHGAMASTEVRQKLHDFLLNKSAKELSPNGTGHPSAHRPKIWYMPTQHLSVDQSSPPLGETPPTFKSPLPTGMDGKDDFPLRKTDHNVTIIIDKQSPWKVCGSSSEVTPETSLEVPDFVLWSRLIVLVIVLSLSSIGVVLQMVERTKESFSTKWRQPGLHFNQI